MTRFRKNVVAVFALTAALSSHAQDLDRKVTVAMIQHATYESLILSLAQHAGLRVAIEPNALSNARTDRPPCIGFEANFDNIPVRYALSWTLHFGNVSASLTNATLVVQKAGGAPRLSRQLSCYAETNGTWMVSLTNLPASTVTLRGEKMLAAGWLAILCHRAGITRYVIDPDLVAEAQETDVEFAKTPTLSALDQVLDRIGAVRVLQGGVYYFRKKR
jgi:hypothetical protein